MLQCVRAESLRHVLSKNASTNRGLADFAPCITSAGELVAMLG